MERHKVLVLFGILFAIALPITLVGRHDAQRQVQSAMGEHFPSEPALVPNSAQSAERSLSAADLAAIQTVITQQITAFQADEAAMAFSFASPEIQARFQTADQFMDMVRSEYPSVYRPQSVNFEAVEIVQGSPVQAVTLLGPAGQWVTAFYQMERQADDTWRIAGCILIPLPGETI